MEISNDTGFFLAPDKSEAIDNFFGKKARERRAERKEKRAEKKAKKAARKAAKGNEKAAARLLGKAKQLLSQSAVLETGQKLGRAGRVEARKAGQDVQASELREAGFDKKAKKVEARQGKTWFGRGLELAKFAPLLPFKGTMVKMIKEKGGAVSMSDPMDKVANLFYQMVIKKDGYEQFFVDYDLTDVTPDHAAVAIGVIVNAILDFFRKSKEKKDQGQSLSKIESQAAKAAEFAQAKGTELQAKAETQAKKEASAKVGEKLLFDEKTQIALGLGLLALIGLFFIAGRGTK